MKRYWKVWLLLALTAVVFHATGSRSGESRHAAAEPQYNDKGELKRPADYRRWVFVGSNIGLEYRNDVSETSQPDKERRKRIGNFHNVYIDAEAYEHYLRTGKFPDRTMLVMDVYEAQENEPNSIVAKGLFPSRQLRIEIAVKNSRRPDGSKTDWAYYDFPMNQPTAKAFPDTACYQCHLKHAEDDNVWVQFYPSLRLHKKAHSP
jgi:hypothetical protein